MKKNLIFTGLTIAGAAAAVAYYLTSKKNKRVDNPCCEADTPCEDCPDDLCCEADIPCEDCPKIKVEVDTNWVDESGKPLQNTEAGSYTVSDYGECVDIPGCACQTCVGDA